MFGEVYLVTNTVTGDTYVGVTRLGVATRWKHHQYRASGDHRSWFHRAIRKYTSEAFTVEAVASVLAPEGMAAAEQAIIRDLRPTYNQTSGGEVTLGRKYDDETKERIRRSNTGKVRTTEQRARNSATKRQQFAERPELREASVVQLARARGAVDEAKRVEAVRKAATGRVWSDESRAKLSASCMGRRYGPEVTERARLAKQKAVVCVTTGACYPTAKHAAEAVGVGHRSVIRVLKGEYPSVKEFKFIYKEQ